MSKFVPELFPELDVSNIRAALPVRGAGQWQMIAQAGNYLVGHGGTVATFGPATVSANTTWGDAYSIIQPSPQNITRLWIITLAPVVTVADGGWEAAEAFGVFYISYAGVPSSADTQSYDWTLSGTKPQTYYIRHDRDTGDSAATSTEYVGISILSDATSATSVVLQSAICMELPKAYLDSSDEGAEDDTCISPHPIAESGDSLDEAFAVVADSQDECNRRHLFNWSNGTTGVATSTTAWTNLLHQDPYVLGRLLTNGETTRTVKVNVKATINSATTAEVKFTASSGDTYTYTSVSNKSAEWLGWQDLDIDCDQMSRMATDGGIRGGTRDSIAIEARRTAGSGTLTTLGLVIAEDGN